ncbi:MAG: PEGA domain-containing protein [Candidatus Omnitrophica bacterium]|nr:PEGA domain-containing protein [Candidatus Omnitrophota bacterium]MDD5652571.1 PEGA domain-containing protein [Candidatus Omnitrophota bacterium]
MLSEQRIRAVLYYLSVLIFILGLPSILSSVLGYKFSRRTLSFTKTGLVVIKTQPSGANVYLDNALLNDKTPATIAELLPGTYHLKIELEKHYPWASNVAIEAGKATRLEKIILFPVRPNIRQLNKEKFSAFWLDEEKAEIYYAGEDNAIYRSDFEGNNYERIATFLQIDPAPVKFVASPDRKKIAYFNKHKIGITYLDAYSGQPFFSQQFVLDYPSGVLFNIFWHSDSYHLVLLANRAVEVLEAKPEAVPIALATLNKKNPSCSYDLHNDTLYFIDSQRAADGNMYDNLYKLELNSRTTLQQLMKMQTHE